MKNHKHTIIGIVGATAVCTLLGASFFFLYFTIKKESVEIKEAETAIAILENKERQVTQAREELTELAQDIDRIERTGVSNETFVAFLESLERLARLAGASFRAESAVLPPSSKGTARLGFELKGDYQSIARFILLLDQLPYAGIVDQLTITPAGATLRAAAGYSIFNVTE